MASALFDDVVDGEVFEAGVLRQGFAVGGFADAGCAGYDYVGEGSRHVVRVCGDYGGREIRGRVIVVVGFLGLKVAMWNIFWWLRYR